MEKYQEIERSIIKKYRKTIWCKFTKAVRDYKLIKDNDKIMVCISGGKDSFLMAKCFQEILRHGKVKFSYSLSLPILISAPLAANASFFFSCAISGLYLSSVV